MATYLVRHTETKEIQGIFWGSLSDIWDAMDEIGDPYGFEFAVLRPGALFTHAPLGEGDVAKQFDQMSQSEMDSADEELSFSWNGFTASETLWSALHYQHELKWKPFDASDSGHGLVSRIFQEMASKDSQ